MKSILKNIENLLAKAKPRRAARTDGDALSDFLGFHGDRRRERMGEAMATIAEHCRPSMGNALRLLERLALRGNLHPRTLLHLAFLHGTLAQEMRHRALITDRFLPAFLEAIGMEHLQVEFTEDGFTIKGLAPGQRVVSGDGGGRAKGKEVTWN